MAQDQAQLGPNRTPEWLTMLHDAQANSFTATKAVKTQNKAALAYAASNAASIVGINATGGPTNSNTSATGTSGQRWRVKFSFEDASSGNGWTELSSNGNGAVAAGLVQSPNCTGGSVGSCDFATLGHAYPHGTQLMITNPANNRSGTFPLTDVGNGSNFGPAIGLTPAVVSALGINGGDSEVIIQLAGGGNLSIVPGFGTSA